jgi:hypothetical protein
MNKTYNIEVYDDTKQTWYVRFANHKYIPSLEEARELISLYAQDVRIVEVASKPVEEYAYEVRLIGKKLKQEIETLKQELDSALTLAEIATKKEKSLKEELEEYRSIAEKMGAGKAISEKEQWEKCADKLMIFAEVIKATEGNSTRNPEYYNRACEVIEEYKRLKNK